MQRVWQVLDLSDSLIICGGAFKAWTWWGLSEPGADTPHCGRFRCCSGRRCSYLPEALFLNVNCGQSNLQGLLVASRFLLVRQKLLDLVRRVWKGVLELSWIAWIIMTLIGTIERTTITFEKSPESKITFILLSTRLSSILCFSCALSAVKASLSLIIL